MVRSESADEEMAVSDKFDATANEDDDDFSPQPIWATNGAHAESGKGNGIASARPISRSASSLSPNSSDPDRRLRRQIANCNERRRMQSINAGFQSLRALLPRKEGEKLSKAAILQHTADLIQQLQSERSRYLDNDEAGGKKPKIEIDDCAEFDQQRSMIDSLQMALERERTARIFLEQQLNQMREMYQNVDVSPRMSVPMPPTPSPMLPPSMPPHSATGPLSAPSAFSSSSITAHRSLQTILDAIRHLEGGALVPPTPSPPPPSSQAPLVR
ncbi:Helix-loop-helix DNA-binding domain protein [Ancylostoma caninum]|nr:Helix-loop-helix DNA-binding domain protein [Ancylostoma caninum]